MVERRIILGSASPRRRELMEKAGFDVVVKVSDVDESFDTAIDVKDVAEMLAIRKAKALHAQLTEQDLLITADSVVILDNAIYNKPVDGAEAFRMLTLLSGRTHHVITGVCIFVDQRIISFSDQTDVTFAPMQSSEIQDYIAQCKPFDKAGAYGIQDWIGWAKIERISGSYSNVMGLPLEKVYSILSKYCTPKIY